jgi:uncharacterized protein YdeI (YjbR/CyaY-like superfamily)
MLIFFETPQKAQAWLKANHKKAKSLKAGFRAKPNGHLCATAEDVAVEMMRYAWRPGRRVAIDSNTYTIMFERADAGAKWSATDTALAERLIAECRMTRQGLALFTKRSGEKRHPEAAPTDLSPTMREEFKQHAAAWAAFQRMPPSHQSRWSAWVMEAKQDATRARRLAKLVMDLGRNR